MWWKIGTVFEDSGRSERHSRAVRAVALVGIAVVALLASGARAQTPANADPPQKVAPQTAAISNDAARNGCADCTKTAAANLPAAAPAPQLAIAEQDAQILHLAAQLKVEVDRCAPDTLQADVVRKANLIRRLANELKKEVKLTLRAK